MPRHTLETWQLAFYVCAMLLGWWFSPSLAPWLDVFGALLMPSLMLLLYATFVQVPLLHIKEAFTDRSFALANLLGNFVFIPLVLWPLIALLPNDPLLLLGVLLVLLVPCTDWFITFTQLGKGSVARAIAISPVNLGLQLLLLPVYVWWILPNEHAQQIHIQAIALLQALLVIMLPLVLAAITESWIEQRPQQRQTYRDAMAWLPVPLLTVVVFLISLTQAKAVLGSLTELMSVIPVFVVFLLLALLIAKAMSHWFKLSAESARTLAFGFGTRNSFIVLPIALSLGAGAELVTQVIVLQSLIELLGMMLFIWLVPRLFR